MKILFVINTLKVGGAAKMLKYVANISTELFDEVAILNLYDKSYTDQDISPKVNHKCYSLISVHRIWRWFKTISTIRTQVAREKPDIVCSFVGHVNVMARMATLQMPSTFISAERGDPYTQSLLWKLLTRWAYGCSDYCFFQLEGARDFFNDNIRKRSYVIPNPYISCNEADPYTGERNKTIVSAGRFAPEKCYDLLIDAFARIHKNNPEYRLILYGEGPMLDTYKKQVQDLNICEFVQFPGYVKSVTNAIYKDGIFVLSSLYEGIPNSLIEAMSIGIPCIATDCTPGGPRFLTGNGKRGILIPVNDVDSLANALQLLIDKPQMAESYGKLAIEVTEILKESNIKTMWLNAFKDIISKIQK